MTMQTCPYLYYAGEKDACFSLPLHILSFCYLWIKKARLHTFEFCPTGLTNIESRVVAAFNYLAH